MPNPPMSDSFPYIAGSCAELEVACCLPYIEANLDLNNKNGSACNI